MSVKNQNGTAVFGADKTKTPLSLQYLLKNRIEDGEFFNSPIQTGNEKQLLWWQHGYTMGQKKRGYLKTLEKLKRLSVSAQEEKKRLEQKNSAYIEKLKKQYTETELQLKLRKEALENKTREMDALSRLNELTHERILLEMEEEFQRDARERAEALLIIEEEKKLLGRFEEAEQKEKIYKEEAQALAFETDKKRAEMDAYLKNAAKGENGTELLTKAKLLARERAESFLREEEDEREALVLRKKNLAERTQAMIYDGDFLPAVKKYEAYNPADIIELKDVSVRNRETGERIISNFTLDLKAGKTGGIYAESPSNLLLLLQVINRTFKNQYIISSGEIRIDGIVTTSVRRQDFDTRFSNTVLDINEIYKLIDNYDKSVKRAITHFSLNPDEVYDFLKLMNADVRATKEYKNKAGRLSVDFKIKLSFAIALAMKLPLLFVSFYDLPISELTALEIIQFMNLKSGGSAVLVFSTDKKMLLKIKDATIYSLK